MEHIDPASVGGVRVRSRTHDIVLARKGRWRGGFVECIAKAVFYRPEVRRSGQGQGDVVDGPFGESVDQVLRVEEDNTAVVGGWRGRGSGQ